MEKPTRKVAAALESCPAYPILDETTIERYDPTAWLKAVLASGARIVQLRMKTATDAYFRSVAKQFIALCREFGAVSIINDRLEIALDLGADGVHLGIRDEMISHAHTIIMSHPEGDYGFIIGGSARLPERAGTLENAGASYIGCGACFETITKEDTVYIGLDKLNTVAESVSIPVVGIGGITWENYAQVLEKGALGFAAIGMFQLAPDEITRRMKSHFPQNG